jgi:hypothetical protein
MISVLRRGIVSANGIAGAVSGRQGDDDGTRVAGGEEIEDGTHAGLPLSRRLPALALSFR